MNDKRSDLVLLYDKNLSEHLIEQLYQLKRPRKEGGFGWKKVVPWESFVGGECDTVVYVGSGSLEAFSRARLKLMIITVSPREQRGDTVNNFYGYNAGLRNSVEKNLLEKKILENTVDSLSPLSTPFKSHTLINSKGNDTVATTVDTFSKEEQQIIKRR